MLQQDNNLFGLDIGELALRLVLIKKRGKKNYLLSHNEIALPKGVIVDGEIIKKDQLKKYIDDLLSKQVKGKKINTNKLISVLPETKTFIKLIDIKAANEDDIKNVLNREIINHIPLDIGEIYFDWQIIDGFKPNKTSKILVGAAPRKLVNSYMEVLKKANLMPFALEIEAAGIIRCLLTKKKELDTGAKIIIDMGAVRTSLILYNQGSVQFTASLPISGAEITKSISEKLKIDYKQAERAKIVCGLDETKCEGALKKILFSNINKLILKINEVINFYHESSDEKNVEEIILCGGGANFSKIDKVLQEKLNIPTKIGNPLSNIYKVNKSAEIKPAKILSFTTAIGLALRGTGKDFI